jgi:hypothetical protein
MPLSRHYPANAPFISTALLRTQPSFTRFVLLFRPCSRPYTHSSYSFRAGAQHTRGGQHSPAFPKDLPLLLRPMPPSPFSRSYALYLPPLPRRCPAPQRRPTFSHSYLPHSSRPSLCPYPHSSRPCAHLQPHPLLTPLLRPLPRRCRVPQRRPTFLGNSTRESFRATWAPFSCPRRPRTDIAQAQAGRPTR